MSVDAQDQQRFLCLTVTLQLEVVDVVALRWAASLLFLDPEMQRDAASCVGLLARGDRLLQDLPGIAPRGSGAVVDDWKPGTAPIE